VRTVMAVGIAGFAGTVARYGVEGLVTERISSSFPWGTLLVNVTGSLVLGFLFAVLIEGRVIVAPWLRVAVTVGFVGAYTTFSTLSLETFRLIEDGSFVLAAANALGSLSMGLVAVYIGVVVGRLI
jgi:fluoride exporter